MADSCLICQYGVRFPIEDADSSFFTIECMCPYKNKGKCTCYEKAEKEEDDSE